MSTTTSAAARTESEFNLLDLLKYLLSKWPWFVVSLAVCCTFAWYKGATAPLVYYSSAKVIIKDPSNKTSSAGLDRYDRSINKVNVANEILQFRSKQLMQQVVSRVHADVVYTTRQGLRDVNVFGETPFTVTFLNLKPNDRFAMEFEPVSANEVELTSINGKGTKAMRMRTGVPYTVNGVKLMFTPTGKWSSKWEGALIKVNKYTVNSMVGYWLGNLGIRQEDEEATILNIAIKSPSRELGAEMLTTLINVYNEESINDKNRVAVNTADFINERLRIIEAELGGVENDLESYKSRNQIVDIGSTASRYMGESARYNADALQFETQMRIALYIKEYLTDPSRSVDLIPSNIGINDAAIESQISQYNALKLQRDKLADDSSEANPVVAEMSATLNTLRTNILRAVDNIIQSINVKRRDAKGYEAQAESRVASIPRKEREMLSIERQQKIKEELYLFLLNRREENALAQAMADNNARIIDDPEDSGTLISPDRVRLMLLGFAVGLMIPTVILLMLRFLDTRVQGRRDFDGLVSVTAGVSYKFGSIGWKTRREVVTRTVYDNGAVNNLRAQVAQLVAENEKLENDLKGKSVTHKAVEYVGGKYIIYFPINVSSLNNADRAQLDMCANAIKGAPEGSKFMITGYADKATGTPEVNEILSRSRAENVRACLVNEHGVDVNRLGVQWKGGVGNMFYDDPTLSRVVIISPIENK